jgi:hypothetical protein
MPAFTIPISKPALMAWYKNAECMASLTGSFPLKEKDIFEQSNIFDAVMWGMKLSAYSNKLKEKDNQNDRSK